MRCRAKRGLVAGVVLMLPLLLYAQPTIGSAQVFVSKSNVVLNVNEAQLPDAFGRLGAYLDAPATAGGTLTYSAGTLDTKITASLSGNLSAGPTGITIRVEARQSDVLEGQVALESGSASAGDLITGVVSLNGSYDLTYRALARLSVPPGSYIGIVTYTVTESGLI